MAQIRVTVPATTANLGPGFDSLGMALNLHNQFTFEHIGHGLEIEVAGEAAHNIPVDESNLVYQSALRLFQLLGRKPAGMRIQQVNRVPSSSGLGSSSTAVVAGLMGANALVNGGLTKLDLVDLAGEMEGHADNVAPALFGGLVLSNILEVDQGGAHFHIECLPIPTYRVVLVLPDVALLTKDARALLPGTISRADATFNIGRMGLLVRALMAGDHGKLALAMDDRLHQPYRVPLIPGFEKAVAAAKQYGNVGCALSGAGPSIVAFTEAHHEAISRDIQAAFSQAGITSRAWVLTSDGEGAVVEEGKEWASRQVGK